jgi:hypothetical protein
MKMDSLQKMIRDKFNEPTWTEKPVLSNLISKLEKVDYTKKEEKEEFANRIFVANSAAENVSHFVALLVPAMQNYSFNASVELEIYRIILSSYELSEDKVNNSANIATQIATFRPWILKRLYEEGFNNLGNIVPTAIFSASSRDAFDYIFKTESKFFKTKFGLTEDTIVGSRMQVEGEEQERDILRAAIDAFASEGERENCFYAAQWAMKNCNGKIIKRSVVEYLLSMSASSKQSLFAGLFLQHIDKINDSEADIAQFKQGLIDAVNRKPEVLTLIDQAHIGRLNLDLSLQGEKNKKIGALNGQKVVYTDKVDTARGTKKVFGVIAAIFACITIAAMGGYFFAATTVLAAGLVAGGSGLLAVISAAFSYSARGFQEDMQGLVDATSEQINFIENTTARIKEQRQADATSTLERIGILKELGALQDEQGHPLKEVSSLEERLKEVVEDPLYGVNVVEPVQQPGVGAKRQALSAQRTEEAQSSISGAKHVASGPEIGQEPGGGRKR